MYQFSAAVAAERRRDLMRVSEKRRALETARRGSRTDEKSIRRTVKIPEPEPCLSC